VGQLQERAPGPCDFRNAIGRVDVLWRDAAYTVRMAHRRTLQVIKRNDGRLAAILLAAIVLATSLSSSAVAHAGVFASPTVAPVAQAPLSAASNATPAITPTDVAPVTPAATITPVTPIPAPTPIPPDQPNNVAKYLVTGIVFASLAVIVGALVVLWFIVD
jgi:hypothetical protein